MTRTVTKRHRSTAPCGTTAGWWRHYNHGQARCDGCKKAMAAARAAKKRGV